MSTSSLTNAISDALAAMVDSDLTVAATDLLTTCGYQSERTLPSQSGDAGDFNRQFPAVNPGTQSEQAFLDNAESVHVLFQFTSGEVQGETQRALFDATGFDTGNARSFLFAAVQLRGDDYPRGQYAGFTRELNKRFPMPMVVLFRTAANLTSLAFVYRQPNKRDPERDVLGSVSLIREINPAKQHRAHLDILSELALHARLRWMNDHDKPHNFDGLLDAWLAALDTEELNRSFYRELFRWFERAVEAARFPSDEARTLPTEEHVIRLITRLMFVWFIKEKGLVAEGLFIEEQVRKLLKDYDQEGGNSYYRAVLQNLFFATLNTEIAHRGFSAGNNSTHRDFSYYRYRNEMADPDAMLALFEETPFINGGLFDCLDSFEGQRAGGYRIDCFSDVHYSKLSIPNRLFFGASASPGLIDLFNRYKFTVEENTPTEQEVALDPELLGKVFENLLAAVNPETQLTARKETGSYYTPRAVVDYMVDEALVATLAQKASPADGDADYWQARLRYLLDYGDAFADAETLFTPAEREAVVRAIAGIKALDPAVGSGAFPMGILHKLTLALRRLDDRNQLWESLQKELAGQRAAATFDTQDPEERESELAEVSRTFDKYRDSDFGRKLYLIQNSIYGVDIQPIATQIAKLRFFISLAIEQQPNDAPADNYGIRPLPNLETRFVAADTLMGLQLDEARQLLQDDAIQTGRQRIAETRARHFLASNRQQKYDLVQEEKRYRVQLEQDLDNLANQWESARQRGIEGRIAQLPKADQREQQRAIERKRHEQMRKAFDASLADAQKITHWDPYDPNASAANWFDSEYMFGVADGFDVVIGNPPYKQIKKGTYPKAQFPYSEGRDKGKQNLYKMFVEQSYNLCKNRGVATLIVQSSLMCDLSSAATRQMLLERTQLRHIIEFPKAAPTREAQVFQSVTQGTCIYQFIKSRPDDRPIRISVDNNAYSIADLRFTTITTRTIENLYPTLRCLPRIGEASVGILEKIAGDQTFKPLRDYVASISQGDLNLTTHSKRFSQKPTKVRLLRGRNIGRFTVKYDTSNEYCDQSFMPGQVKANREGVFLISQEVTGTNDVRRLHFGLAEKPPTDFLCGHSVNKTQLRNQAHSKAFLALLNSKFLDWLFRITSSNNHVQGYELERLPIPEMSASDREQLGKLADRIAKAKAGNPAADTSTDEVEIDRLVYRLYGLTDAEIAEVEGKREEVEKPTGRDQYDNDRATQPADRERFRELADQWESETVLLSNSERAAAHPTHQEIVGMGQPAVPLILERMQSQGGHWFHALRDITGTDPVSPEERGNVAAMQEAWLDWGKLNGVA